MPKKQGLLQFFTSLDKISCEGVSFWLGDVSHPKIIQNQLYNRFLYPQTISTSLSESKFDLALLHEALKSQPETYFDQNFRKIFIPEGLLGVGNLQQVVGVFLDVFCGPQSLQGNFVTLYLKSEKIGTKNLGTFVRPNISSKNSVACFWVNNKKYEVKSGSLITISAPNNRTDIKFESSTVQILGKNNMATEIVGGTVGLIVDMR